jgi:pyruvate/2-oxoglutarate dehydrogenase complex dihydrolipoamide dehydrogenase (E3) component
MASVQRRKRIMVEGLHQLHVDREAASGGELIIGNARFVAPRTVEVALNDGGTRTIFADRVILALGSRATMPNIPGLSAA